MLTQAIIDLDNLTHNMCLLQQQVGARPLWPAIKANAYGHDAGIIGRHLVRLGYSTLCVAQGGEAAALTAAGVRARFIVLSATLPEDCELLIANDCEPVICTLPVAQRLADVAARAGKQVAVHVNVDTGMGRVGLRADQVRTFLQQCKALPALKVKGLMSHFPCADEADKTFSYKQIEVFKQLQRATADCAIGFYHMANSAAIFDLPAAHFDAARPGIAIYGLQPSAHLLNTAAQSLRPVLRWQTRITFLKEVPAGTGLSYGHTFYTPRPSLIATIPVGYGDGLSRLLSNRISFLVRGRRCAQVGRITMDQSLLDVSELRGRVAVGDEVVIIGTQGNEQISADDLAETIGTINYEIVTAISRRIPRRGVAATESADTESINRQTDNHGDPGPNRRP